MSHITIFQDDGSELELELAFNPGQSRDAVGRFGEGTSDKKSKSTNVKSTKDDVKKLLKKFSGTKKPSVEETVAAFEQAYKDDSVETVLIVPNVNTLTRGSRPQLIEGTRDEVEVGKGLFLATVSHNHPDGDALSIKDIQVAAKTGMSEIRVVVPDGTTYSMKPVGVVKLWPSQNEFNARLRTSLLKFVSEEEVRSSGFMEKQKESELLHKVWTDFTAEPFIINGRLSFLAYSRERAVRAAYRGGRGVTIFQDDGSELELAFNPTQSRDVVGRFGAGGAKRARVKVADDESPVASPRESRVARRLALAKVAAAPIPSEDDVRKAKLELEAAKRGEGRAGGESRGGSAAARRKQRETLFKEFGGEDRGYVVCPWTGTKMHWSADSAVNPRQYPTFERGKIFTKSQGGGYQLPNLIPESFTANRARGAKALR